MRKDHSMPRGTLHRLTLDSLVLKGNLLGDPTERDVTSTCPHGHDGKGFPLLVDLVGFTAGGPGHTNWKNFGENLPERLDRLIGAGAMPPCVVAFPDCFTKLGGNQYINSAAMGRWDDFLRRGGRAFRRGRDSAAAAMGEAWMSSARARADTARSSTPCCTPISGRGGKSFRRHRLRARLPAGVSAPC